MHMPRARLFRPASWADPRRGCPWQRLLETAPLHCELAVLDECAAATAEMVQAATPPPPPPPPPPRLGVPARALAAPTAEESAWEEGAWEEGAWEDAVAALVAAARFACLRFVQRAHSDGGPQWQRMSSLLELIAPRASPSHPIHPAPSAEPTRALDARLGELRAEMSGFLRRPRGEPATQAAEVPSLDDHEERCKLLSDALGDAAELWTPPTRCRRGGDSALPPPLTLLRQMVVGV